MGDNIMAAMPETGIGPARRRRDGLLNACPGRTGLYLGLTGARLDTADAIYAGSVPTTWQATSIRSCWTP